MFISVVVSFVCFFLVLRLYDRYEGIDTEGVEGDGHQFDSKKKKKEKVCAVVSSVRISCQGLMEKA